MEIIRYSGNAKPFLYAVFAESDKQEAESVLKNLLENKYSLWYEKAFGRHAKKRMEKSTVVILFMSPAASMDQWVNDAIHFAVLKNLPIITIYLSPTGLTAAQKLQLNTYQGLMKYSHENEADFYSKLYSTSAMQWTSISPAQKKQAGRNGVMSWAMAALVIAIILFTILISSVGGSVRRGSTLDSLGYGGSLSEIEEVYVYATQKMEENKGASKLLKEGESDYLKIIETGDMLFLGNIKDISDFSQLKSLKEMVFTGNVVSDISPLYKLDLLQYLDVSCNPVSDLKGIEKLPSLKTLNISYTSIADISPLLSCGALETVYVSCNMDDLFKDRQPGFQVKVSEHDWSDWKATVERTAGEEGFQQRICETCKEVETKPIANSNVSSGANPGPGPTPSPTPSSVQTPGPTAETPGSRAAHQHNWSEWDVIVEPTPMKEGSQERFCSICGEMETVVIPADDVYHISIDKLRPHIFGGVEEQINGAGGSPSYGIYIYGATKDYTYIFRKNGTVIDCYGREYLDDDGDGLPNKTHIWPDPLQMSSYDRAASYTLEVSGNEQSYTYGIKHKFVP